MSEWQITDVPMGHRVTPYSVTLFASPDKTENALRQLHDAVNKWHVDHLPESEVKTMKEPLKIEAGKWYRARNGEKVFACGPSALGLGMIRVETADETTWRVFAAGGRCFADNPNPSDLIEEWREPITKTTTVYMDRDGVSWVTTQSAPGHAIASVKVTLTEGQFAQ